MSTNRSRIRKTLALIVTGAALLGAGQAMAQNPQSQFFNSYKKARTFEVTITNITQNQFFTPLLAATHTNEIAYFTLGEEPLPELADLAEGGDTGGLQSLLDGLPDLVMETNASEGLLGPGESTTITISGSRKFNRLSLAGMLLPTNDTFVAINSMVLPVSYRSEMAVAYDAGSEENDELCASIPGPQCGGTPFSEGLAEGFVHVSRGISGNGDLAPSAYDWRNPVARVTLRRVD